MDSSNRIPTVNDLRVRFYIMFLIFHLYWLKTKYRSNFAIYAERKSVLTVVSLFYFVATNRKLETDFLTFSARTSTTGMDASMYMHTSCTRTMSTQMDTNFTRKLFACTKCSQVSSVRNDIQIGKQ